LSVCFKVVDISKVLFIGTFTDPRFQYISFSSKGLKLFSSPSTCDKESILDLIDSVMFPNWNFWLVELEGEIWFNPFSFLSL